MRSSQTSQPLDPPGAFLSSLNDPPFPLTGATPWTPGFDTENKLHREFPGSPVVSAPLQETWVRSLGWEDLLEKGMATHSSILAWRIPWMEEPGELQSIGLQRVGHDWSDLACMHALYHHHHGNFSILG